MPEHLRRTRGHSYRMAARVLCPQTRFAVIVGGWESRFIDVPLVEGVGDADDA